MEYKKEWFDEIELELEEELEEEQKNWLDYIVDAIDMRIAILFVVGVDLYMWGQDYALKQRGYIATGGEIFFLLIPIFYYIYKILEEME